MSFGKKRWLSASARWDGGFGVVWHRETTFLALPLSTRLPCLCPGTTVILNLRAPPRPTALSPVGNLSQAVENVLSVLLFYPEDEAAKKALNEYQAQLGEPRPGLGPREVTLCPMLTL